MAKLLLYFHASADAYSRRTSTIATLGYLRAGSLFGSLLARATAHKFNVPKGGQMFARTDTGRCSLASSVTGS